MNFLKEQQEIQNGLTIQNILQTLLPIGIIVLSFWFVIKKRRERENKKSNKNDLWYLIKEYLKVTDRQGYKIADLTFYPRANNIALLREHIIETKELLKIQKTNLFGEKKERLSKIKTRLCKKWPIKKLTYFPLQEEYQRKIELYTLNVLAKKYFFFQSLLQEYEKHKERQKFKELISKRLIGESLAKITKNKKINSRNRYLVCFKTINKNEIISDWEAIEIELFKNPKAQSKEKYKVLFTASLDYSKELHWIYAQQCKYLKDKEEEAKSIAKKIKKDEKKKNSKLSKFSTFLSTSKKFFLNFKNKKTN